MRNERLRKKSMYNVYVICMLYVNCERIIGLWSGLWSEMQSIPILMHIVIFVHRFVASLNCGECLIKVVHSSYELVLNGPRRSINQFWKLTDNLIGVIIGDRTAFRSVYGENIEYLSRYHYIVTSNGRSHRIHFQQKENQQLKWQ